MLDSDVSLLVSRLLGTRIAEAQPVPMGYGNETWRVAASGGERYTVKFGPLASEPKWRSAHRALELAGAAGVPVARLVCSGHHADRVVRVFDWIEGRTPTSAVLGDDAVRRLFSGLGSAVRALHEIELGAFSSRLDGSAQSFARWPDYIRYRLSAIRARCLATRALDEHALDRVCEVIGELAAEVGDAARPTLCHRDLHADNLLVDPTGRLVAILDFDMAEAWDCAGESFKLDRFLFPAFPGAQRWFDAAYRGGRPRPSYWDERVRLVALIEALNALPNAIANGWNETTYGADARRWLHALLDPS